MKVLAKFSLIFGFAVMAVGCSSGLDKKAAIDWSKGGIVAISVDAKNLKSPKIPFTKLTVKAKNTDANGTSFDFSNDVDEMGRAVLVRQLPAGQYEITGIYGIARAFPITGSMGFDVKSSVFTVKGNEISYIGHMSVENIDKTNEDQISSGGPIPLIDQAIAGFTTGTLRFRLGNEYKNSLMTLRNEYTGLKETPATQQPISQLSVPLKNGKAAVVITNEAKAQ